MSMFPTPDFEPPPGEPSWAWIAGLLAAGAVCIVVVLAVSGCGDEGCKEKELVGISGATPIYKYRDCE